MICSMCEEEQSRDEEDGVCVSVKQLRFSRRGGEVRGNNSSSQKYAAVQPGPLSTGSMTDPGWVIPLIEECAASKLPSACLPACCKLLLTLTRLLQISCRFGKVLSESCPFSWESAKISTPLPDDRPKSKEASPFCCTWAAFSRVSESIVPVDGGRLVATAEASQTTRLYPETRPRRGGRPELVSDTRPPLSSLSAM